jgi:hypothetical protein
MSAQTLQRVSAEIVDTQQIFSAIDLEKSEVIKTILSFEEELIKNF